jgi:hypothetical protein
MARLQGINRLQGWETDRLIDIVGCGAAANDIPVVAFGANAACGAVYSGSKPDFFTHDHQHLDAETIQWLEVALREYHGTVIIVTHDRYFLDNITKWILELDKGRGLPLKGTIPLA